MNLRIRYLLLLRNQRKMNARLRTLQSVQLGLVSLLDRGARVRAKTPRKES